MSLSRAEKIARIEAIRKRLRERSIEQRARSHRYYAEGMASLAETRRLLDQIRNNRA